MFSRNVIASLVVTISCCLAHGVCGGQELSAYEAHRYSTPGLNMVYRLLRPLDPDSGRRYPLLIFLHGAASKGFDNEAQLGAGGAFFLRDSIRQRYPAYVLFPQCPPLDSWAEFQVLTDTATGKFKGVFPFKKQPTEASAVLMQLVDSLLAGGTIDPARVYIAGISQGGMGVLDLLARYPQRFAAGLSFCGAGKATTARNFAHSSALWLFHGNADDVVPVSYSRDYYRRLKKEGADVRYSEYEGVGHACWIQGFREPELMAWLFGKRRN
jgi:predicted peptidase